MKIIICESKDIPLLAKLNQQLIEDEKSDNKMNIEELEERMRGFLAEEYQAYFFHKEDEIIGYALVRKTCTPYYLRQFLIDRRYRRMHYGEEAFAALLEYLRVENIDIEVLSWNEAGVRFWEKLGFKERSRYMRWEKK